MKIALLSVDGGGFPIAYHLQEEGHEVYVGQVPGWSDVHVKSKEKPEEREKRLMLYHGLLEHKMTAERLTSFLLGQPDSRIGDWFVLCDFNWLWPYSDKLRKAGFRGLLPHHEDFMLEHDRAAMRELVEKLYPNVDTSDYREFKTSKDGIEFLNNSDGKDYILKGFNTDAKTVLPDNDDVDVNVEVLIAALANDKDRLYEKDGFILEEIIHDAIEFTPEAYGFNGQLRSISVDVEHKRMGSRSGPMTGCSMDAVLWQDANERLYDMFLAPLETRMLRPNELTIWDLSVLYSPERDKFYAGEFCPNRMGFDAVFTEICTFGSATNWLESIMGEERDKLPVGISLRVFNIDKSEQLFVGDPADPNVWCFDLCDRKGELYSLGAGKDAYVITQAADDIDTAITGLYKLEKGTEFLDGYHLQESDWLDTEYHCNILHRIDVLEGLGLIQQKENYATQEENSRRNG